MDINITDVELRTTLPGIGEVDVTFLSGDRVTWKNPCGLAGTEVSGVFMGGEGSLLGEYCVGIDAEPSESLRKLASDLSPVFAASREFFERNGGKNLLVHKSGLDGNGGLFVVTGEAFERAVRDGHLTLTPLPAEAARRQA